MPWRACLSALLTIAGGPACRQRWAQRRTCRAGRLRAACAERLGCTPSLKRQLTHGEALFRGDVRLRGAAPAGRVWGSDVRGTAPELKNACCWAGQCSVLCQAGGRRARGPGVSTQPLPHPASGHPSLPPRRLLPGSRASSRSLLPLSGTQSPPVMQWYAIPARIMALLFASAPCLRRPAGNAKHQEMQACRWWRGDRGGSN